MDDASPAHKEFLNIENILSLRVYDIPNQQVFEDLDVYLNKNNVTRRRTKEFRDIVIQELSQSDGITDRKNWQDNKPSIVLTASNENKSGMWISLAPATEAKKFFEEQTGIINLPESGRRKNPKDYRTYMDYLVEDNIRRMPIFDMANLEQHERLSAFMFAKKMTKQQNKGIMRDLKTTLTDMIRSPDRTILKDDKPAIVAEFNKRTRGGVEYNFVVVPTYQAQSDFNKRCSL